LEDDLMFKRLLAIVAIAAALAACSPSTGGSGDPALDATLEPTMDASAMPSLDASASPAP
jgi:hypothetical protein